MFKLAKHLVDVDCLLRKATSYEEERAALLKLIQPIVPAIKLTGDRVFPPEHKNADDVSLILCNHISDADQMLVMRNIQWHINAKHPVKFTGFTYSSFQYVPVIGQLVQRSFIGLEAGEPGQDIETKISWLLDQGFNTWLLFPEGTLFDKHKYKKSLEYQKSLGIAEDKLLHNVLYPRVRALNAFLKVVGKRLKHIIDVTLEYADYDPKTKERSYTAYPSALYLALSIVKPPSFHVRVYNVSDQWITQILSTVDSEVTPTWLVNLWRIKDQTLRKKQQIRKQLQHTPPPPPLALPISPHPRPLGSDKPISSEPLEPLEPPITHIHNIKAHKDSHIRINASSGYKRPPSSHPSKKKRHDKKKTKTHLIKKKVH